ncbi:hypothetical protein, partial [Alistipes dispar]
SEGYRFESCRRHRRKRVQKALFLAFRECPKKKEWKPVPRRTGFTFRKGPEQKNGKTENREKAKSRTQKTGKAPKPDEGTGREPEKRDMRRKARRKKGMPDKVSSASKNHPCRRLLRQG